jgi:WD40 repeat protein
MPEQELHDLGVCGALALKYYRIHWRAQQEGRPLAHLLPEVSAMHAAMLISSCASQGQRLQDPVFSPSLLAAYTYPNLAFADESKQSVRVFDMEREETIAVLGCVHGQAIIVHLTSFACHRPHCVRDVHSDEHTTFGDIVSVMFTVDSRFIIVATADSSFWIWDYTSPEENKVRGLAAACCCRLLLPLVRLNNHSLCCCYHFSPRTQLRYFLKSSNGKNAHPSKQANQSGSLTKNTPADEKTPLNRHARAVGECIGIYGCVPSAYGKQIVSWNQGHNVEVWHLAQAVANLQDHPSSATTSTADTIKPKKKKKKKVNGTVYSILLRGHTGQVRCARWSADGRKLVSASDDTTLIVWCAHSFAKMATLRGHKLSVTHIECPLLTGTGGMSGIVVSASVDKTVRIWSLESNEQLAMLIIADRPVSTLAVHSLGHTLAVGQENGAQQLFSLEGMSEYLQLEKIRLDRERVEERKLQQEKAALKAKADGVLAEKKRVRVLLQLCP